METARERDTTSQTGKQMSWDKGKQMNWRQPESWTPPARLGDKWIATRGQMNSGHPESQTPPSEHSRTSLERELRTPTVNCLGTDGRHKAQGGGHSPWHRTWETKDGRQMMGDTEPREADTAPDTRRTHLKIELSTPTVSCLGNDGRQMNWETNPPKADTALDTGPGRQMN